METDRRASELTQTLREVEALAVVLEDRVGEHDLKMADTLTGVLRERAQRALQQARDLQAAIEGIHAKKAAKRQARK